MRILQIVLFVVAVLAFIIAVIFAGSGTGDIFWRAGMALLLLDIVCIMLWPDKTKT